MTKASINEIFSSIQGEGIYIGVRQIFVRFYRCNMACTYCDTKESIKSYGDMFCVERKPGSGEFQWFRNPVSAQELLEIVDTLEPRKHHSLSLTGGEPLLSSEFLNDFLTLFQGRCPVFLETNGILWGELERILPYIDIISMDIKLPSAVGLSYWEEHEKFLRMAREKIIYVKMVLTGETKDDEIKQAVGLINRVDSTIPLVLQPVTPKGLVKAAAPQDMIRIQDHCSLTLKDVRVIPQTHKICGLL